MKKSIFSIVSFIIGIWLWSVVLVGLGVRVGLYGSFESPLFIVVLPLAFFPYAEFIWATVSVVFGGIGLYRKEPKKIFAIIGIVLTISMMLYSWLDVRQYQKTHPNTFPTEEERNQPGFQP